MAAALSSSWKEEEEWHRQLEELTNIVDLQESATRHFEEKATWLSIGYVIFGAILYNTIITAQQSGSADNENHVILGRIRWIPLSLSLSVSVAFWLQLGRSIRRFVGISNQSDISWTQMQRMQDLKFLDQDGQTAIQLTGTSTTHKKRRNWMLDQRCIYISVVVSALIIYTLAVLHACISFS